jgi:hypothetical protein
MLHIDIDTWRSDAAADLRVHAAARRARAHELHRLLRSWRTWLARPVRRAGSRTACTV